MITSIRNYGIFVIVGLLFMGLLVSNKGGLILTHKHKIQFNDSLVTCTGVLIEECRVNLTSGLYPENKYDHVIQRLESLGPNDTVYFHLGGPGGFTSVVTRFKNSMDRVGYKTVSVVENNVYSGHAVLAMMTDKITIGDAVLFMFHVPRIGHAFNAPEDICEPEDMVLGRDGELRPKTKNEKKSEKVEYESCLERLKLNKKITTKSHLNYIALILTEDELEKYNAHADVYLTGDEMKKRLKRRQ